VKPLVAAGSEYLRLRLRRIEGQVRGLQRMVDRQESDLDVITQLVATASPWMRSGSCSSKAICRAAAPRWTTGTVERFVRRVTARVPPAGQPHGSPASAPEAQRTYDRVVIMPAS